MCIFTFPLNDSPYSDKVGLEIKPSSQQVNPTHSMKERMNLSSES